MSLSEAFLRLASALVAWMLLYTYFIWLAALHVVPCGASALQMLRLLLVVVPFVIGSELLLRTTAPLPDIQAILRWFALPLAVVFPFAVKNVWYVWTAVTFGSADFCAIPSPTAWQEYWAPAQGIVSAFCVYKIVRVWRWPDTASN